MLKKNKIFFKKNNCLDPPLSYILLYFFGFNLFGI